MQSGLDPETTRDTQALRESEPDWLTRTAGLLRLHSRPHSLAARDIDELTVRCSHALGTVCRALGIDEAALPPVRIFLSEVPGPADAPLVPDSLDVWLTHTSETPCTAPEVELTHALLRQKLGPASPPARFWDAGLAGYLASVAVDGVMDDPETRCWQLLDEARLPPLEELVEVSGTRMPGLVGIVATAFAKYLIDRHGLGHYRRLLHLVREEDPAAFRRVYRRPLAVADRDWRRLLERGRKSSETSLAAMLRRLLPLARPYWRSGILILVYTLIGIGFSIALPLAFRFMIDNVLSRRPLDYPVPFVGQRGEVIAAGQEQLAALLNLLLVLGVLYVMNAAARIRLNTLINAVGESFVLDLRKRMLGVLTRLPAAYYARASAADLNHRVMHDTVSIQQALTGSLIPVASGLLAAALYAGMLLALQSTLAVVAFSGLPALAVIYWFRRRNLRAASRERARRVADLSGRVGELAAGQILVKIYAAAPALLAQLARRLGVHAQLNTTFALESSRLGQAGALLMHLTQVAVLLVGGYIVVVSDGDALAPGGLVAFYVLMNQLFGPVTQVAGATQGLAVAAAGLERVTEVLEQPTEQDPPDAAVLGPLRRAIELRDVSFSYVSGRPVLRRLRLRIPAGQTVAFVGPTGAGKSTIAQLLPRLYDTTHGSITWDGVDLRNVSLASLRRQIAFVPQDPFLLSATIYENIRFGLPAVSEREVEEAARLAQAHDFITDLAHGYETVVGENGIGLSGGQRQRIALARALLRAPSVLILDEATSALDATTQRALQDELHAGPAERTVIRIAHRLETVASADIIFVLEDGRLVEQGTHPALLAKGGAYARLFEDQMGMLSVAGRPTRAQVLRWLMRLGHFAELPPSVLDTLAQALITIERHPGDVIYSRGSAPDELYVIGRGRVDMLVADAAGQDRVVNSLGAGATFGEVGFFTGTPRPVTVRAATEVLLFVLPQTTFRQVAARSEAAAVPDALCLPS